MCQEKVKIKPRSCIDYLRNGARTCGYYKIYNAVGNGVHCVLWYGDGAWRSLDPDNVLEPQKHEFLEL